MFHRKRLNEVRQITKQYIEGDIEVPELIPHFHDFYKKRFKGFSAVIWFIITAGALFLCSYQILNRIIYFSSSPVKVEASISEELVGDFPAIILLAIYTDETNKIKQSILAKNPSATECRQFPNFNVDNKTDITSVWDALTVQPMITNALFQKIPNEKTHQLSIENIHSLIAVQTIIKNVDKVPIDPQAKIVLKFHVERPLRRDEADIFLIYMQPKKKISIIGDYPMARFVNQYQHTNVQYTFKQYKFLNRKKIPCVEEEEESKCRQNCFVRCIEDDINPSCQLPFLPKRNRPNCLLTNSTCDYIKAISKKVSKLNPHYYCKCARACNKIAFNTNTYFNDQNDKTAIISSYSNLILTLSEYFSYDFIALLCDIGGYLGLYIGISCIALMEIIINNIQNYRNNVAMSQKMKTRLKRNIQHKIHKCIKKYKKNDAGLTGKINFNSRVMKAIKILVLFVCTCLSLYMIVIRITEYFSYLVSTSIEVIEDEIVHMPAVVVCTDNEIVRTAKIEMIENKNLSKICAADLSIAELLDEPSPFAHNAAGLWKESSNIGDFKTMAELNYDATYINQNYGHKSSLLTIFGNCTKVQSAKMQYAPASGYFLTIEMVNNDGCNSHSKIFLTTGENRIDFTASWILPHNTWAFVTLTRQTIIRLNTLANPCTDLEEFKKCEKNCLERKMNDQNIICRLPFMKSPASLPLCATSISAKQTIQSYLKIYSGNVDVYRDCKCRPVCEHNFHTSHVVYDQTFTDHIEFLKLILSQYELDSNFREIFKQELMLPLIKVVCDVGSIVGFYLGISFFSFTQKIPAIAFFFNSYSKKPKKVYKCKQCNSVLRSATNI